MLRKLQTIKAIVCTLTLAVICGLSTTWLRAQESNVQPGSEQMERSSEAQGRRFEGSWEVIVDPNTPTPRHVYNSISRGGVYIGSDRLQPFAGPQHGVWEHLGGDRYAYFFKQDQFDDKGKFVGVLTLRARLSLVGKDEFAGVAQGDIVEPNGNQIQLPCGMIRGIRIKLEPLPDRCRAIMPGL